MFLGTIPLFWIERIGKKMKKVLAIILLFALAFSSFVVLAEEPAEYKELSKGSKGDAVKALQERLKELGFYSSSIDGDYGNGTVKAVKAFEEYNDLEQTGTASSDLQAFLFSDKARGPLSGNTIDSVESVGYENTNLGISVSLSSLTVKKGLGIDLDFNFIVINDSDYEVEFTVANVAVNGWEDEWDTFDTVSPHRQLKSAISFYLDDFTDIDSLEKINEISSLTFDLIISYNDESITIPYELTDPSIITVIK